MGCFDEESIYFVHHFDNDNDYDYLLLQPLKCTELVTLSRKCCRALTHSDKHVETETLMALKLGTCESFFAFESNLK